MSRKCAKEAKKKTISQLILAKGNFGNADLTDLALNMHAPVRVNVCV